MAKTNLADWMQETAWGHSEWDGVISACQQWYYGYVSKTAWCATFVSWAAYHCGILHQIGGKNENVYNMMQACKNSGYGTFYTDNTIQIKKGDILFYNWDGGTMTTTSSKHVGVAFVDNANSNSVLTIGGNQKDKCCRLYYDRSYIQGIFRPNYNEEGD